MGVAGGVPFPWEIFKMLVPHTKSYVYCHINIFALILFIYYLFFCLFILENKLHYLVYNN